MNEGVYHTNKQRSKIQWVVVSVFQKNLEEGKRKTEWSGKNMYRERGRRKIHMGVQRKGRNESTKNGEEVG